jgi:putative transposase
MPKHSHPNPASSQTSSNPTCNPRVPTELRLRVLAAIDYAPGNSIRERIKAVAERSFLDAHRQHTYRFTWRTISTWLYRFKKDGITTLDAKRRSDRGVLRKVQLTELAEAIHEALPSLSVNKQKTIPKSALYRRLLASGLFTRSQLAPTTFYRRLREHQLLDSPENTERLRLSFAMPFANDLWQADTLHGPSIQVDGAWRKTFLIAFLDDASRLVTHAQFFYHDDTESMVDAFRTALYKRGKPTRLYFDNGSNYRSTVILKACLRIGIHLSHAPIRDGAAKGKIERFFRSFRDRFLTAHTSFASLSDLNQKTAAFIEADYNNHFHSGIQMKPIDRFNLDVRRIHYLTNDQFGAEVFYLESTRKVSKTNVFSLHAKRYECPVDLRNQTIDVRFDKSQQTLIVFYQDKRMGEATLLDLTANALRHEPLNPDYT